MRPFTPRRSLLLACTALAAASLLAACTTPMTGGVPGPAAEAPMFAVGDRWDYLGRDGYRVAIVWTETHEITAIGADGITVHIVGKGSTGNFERTEKWLAPGIVQSGAVYESETDRFDPPLTRFKYPLTPGETWSQSVRNLDQPPGPFGPIRRVVNVGGYESVSTAAGTFDALKMRIFMQLDDETFYRYPTQCTYVMWYAPAAKAWVKQEQRSYYLTKEGRDTASVPGQNATIELVSFTPGRR
jgi:hypothetical protein